MKTLQVVCALIIDNEGKLLACKRGSHQSHPNQWEFPGGKVKATETKEEAIVREIYEELQITIKPRAALNVVTHKYPDCNITLSPYLCDLPSQNIPSLTEHSDMKWLNLKKSTPFNLNWTEADIPILRQYILSL